MPILTNPRDAADQIQARSSQHDPWVMYLVIRQDVAVAASELTLAAARATMRCDALHRDREAWRDAFRTWAERSFRKVTLRAKGSAWSKLEPLDFGAGAVRDTEIVRALPPRLRSECGPLLRSLQVFHPDPSSFLSEPPAIIADASDSTPSMGFVINPSASMSIGKQVAQVAHAVLMCAWSSWASDPRYQPSFAAWREADYPCRLLPPSAWSAMRESADGVVVRDAGLTEVDPGTETVIAVPPGWHVTPR